MQPIPLKRKINTYEWKKDGRQLTKGNYLDYIIKEQ
jgi:hypothetical protein